MGNSGVVDRGSRDGRDALTSNLLIGSAHVRVVGLARVVVGAGSPLSQSMSVRLITTKLGPRGRHELVLTIERGISLKAAAAADPVSPNEREPGRRFGISNPVSRIVR